MPRGNSIPLATPVPPWLRELRTLRDAQTPPSAEAIASAVVVLLQAQQGTQQATRPPAPDENAPSALTKTDPPSLI